MSTAKTDTFRYPVSYYWGQLGTAQQYYTARVVYLRGENNYTDNKEIDNDRILW